MILIALFLVIPLVFGLIVEYIVCRLTRRRLLRVLPPLVTAAMAVLIAYGRVRIWSSTAATPTTQLLIFPVLPACFLFLGLYLGWRLWRWRWLPRVVREKKREGE